MNNYPASKYRLYFDDTFKRKIKFCYWLADLHTKDTNKSQLPVAKANGLVR